MLVGADRFLVVTPIWLLFTTLVFLTITILHFIREKFEGMAYNISYSSELGDLLLIACITLGVTIMQREGRVPGSILGFPLGGQTYQTIVLAGAIIAAGACIAVPYPHITPADAYHNTFVVWLLVLLTGLSVVPGLAAANYAHPWERGVMAVMFIVYAGSAAYDKQVGRDSQLRWMMKHRPWEKLIAYAHEFERKGGRLSE